MSNFRVWVENGSSTNVQNFSTFDVDSERIDGFVSGTPAHSIAVNSALRQANLVAVALIEAFLPDNTTLNLTSTVNDVKAALLNAIQSKLTIDPNPSSASTNPVTSGGVYSALATKQNVLYVGSTPVDTVVDNAPNSSNTARLVTSAGVATVTNALSESVATARGDITDIQEDVAGILNGSQIPPLASRVGDNTAAYNFDISDLNNHLTIQQRVGNTDKVWRIDRFSKIYNPLSPRAIAQDDTITLTQLVKAGDRLRFEYYPFWDRSTGKQLKYTEATVTYLDDANASLGIYLTDTIGSTTSGVRFINAVFKIDETGTILTFSQDRYYNIGNSSSFSNAGIHLSGIYKII